MGRGSGHGMILLCFLLLAILSMGYGMKLVRGKHACVKSVPMILVRGRFFLVLSWATSLSDLHGWNPLKVSVQHEHKNTYAGSVKRIFT